MDVNQNDCDDNFAIYKNIEPLYYILETKKERERQNTCHQRPTTTPPQPKMKQGGSPCSGSPELVGKACIHLG